MLFIKFSLITFPFSTPLKNKVYKNKRKKHAKSLNKKETEIELDNKNILELQSSGSLTCKGG